MPPKPADAWERHIAGLTSFAENYTDNALKRECSPAAGNKLIRKLELVADTEIGRMYAQIASMPEPEREKWTPDCKAGCSHCCYQVVAVTVPELLGFVDYIFNHCTPNDIERFKEEARLYREHYESVPEGIHPMFKCPILTNDLCGAYEGRCLVCRGYNSVDVNKCIEFKDHPERPGEIPGVTQINTTALNIRTGMRRGLRKKGLFGELVVLGLGLEIALNDPTVAERYYAGEDVFATARMPEKYLTILQS